MEMSPQEFTRIRRWIARNARPLDYARFLFHFEGGPKEAVLSALAAYQNDDGGFGHALEADCWNPDSAPLQTSTAVGILDEVDFKVEGHPIVQGILRYLESGCDRVNGRWLFSVPSNDLHPHAPWWSADPEGRDRSEFNPTALLAGFLLRFAPCSSTLQATGIRLAEELVSSFLQDEPLDMHPLFCVLRMLEDIGTAGMQDLVPYAEAVAKARKRGNDLIERDPSRWGDYVCRPSFFIRSSDTPLLDGNEAILDKELDYLLSTRNADGVWDLTWRWAGYEREFSISEIWWKADIALRNLRLLREFDRLVVRIP